MHPCTQEAPGWTSFSLPVLHAKVRCAMLCCAVVCHPFSLDGWHTRSLSGWVCVPWRYTCVLKWCCMLLGDADGLGQEVLMPSHGSFVDAQPQLWDVFCGHDVSSVVGHKGACGLVVQCRACWVLLYCSCMLVCLRCSSCCACCNRCCVCVVTGCSRPCLDPPSLQQVMVT